MNVLKLLKSYWLILLLLIIGIYMISKTISQTQDICWGFGHKCDFVNHVDINNI